MATATSTTIEVEQITTVEEKVITLELSQDEAQFILDVVGLGINGSSDTRRRYSNIIYAALRKAGLECTSRDFAGILTFGEAA